MTAEDTGARDVLPLGGAGWCGKGVAWSSGHSDSDIITIMTNI